LWWCLYLMAVSPALGQQAPAKPRKEGAPTSPPAAADSTQDEPMSADWCPQLLDGIISSPNNEAQSSLVRAAFAAGPAILPQLAEALKDDRTAEFAAQAVAYIGGNRALPILWQLLSDPRDLNLRRFTYGALAEFTSPQATDMLFDIINKSDSEPDRTVTEAAVIALTARTDPALIPRMIAAEKKLQDVVIRDDLDNARAVIEQRSKYLATPEGRKSGGSIQSAVRTYFLPALGPPPGTEAKASGPAGKGAANASRGPAAKPQMPLASVDIRNVTFSLDNTRALVRVSFEDPTAIAYYDFVLEKRYGDWTIASVWLGPEEQKSKNGTDSKEGGNRDSEP